MRSPACIKGLDTPEAQQAVAEKVIGILPAEAPLALATTALGGIVGLVATSPGSRSGG